MNGFATPRHSRQNKITPTTWGVIGIKRKVESSINLVNFVFDLR